MVHQPQNLTPEQQVAAAKERLRSAARQVSQDLDRTADETQDRLVHTVQKLRQQIEGTADHLQERLEFGVGQTMQQVEDGFSHLRHQVEETTQDVQHRVQQAGEEIGKTVRETIGQHPFEAIAIAAIAGLAVGHLTSSRKHQTTQPGFADYQPSENFEEQRQNPTSKRASWTQGVAASAGGVGQMVWEVVRQEYLSPEQIRGWLHRVIGKPRGEGSGEEGG